MANKDPAALFFIDVWLTATAEMRADCRGWFLNLILHQFDKKDLPNDVEELASLAQVRVSEYETFKQVFEQVLQHKFELNEKGRLENGFAKQILKKREGFKEKRSAAGRMSYFIKFIRRRLCRDENIIFFVKNNANLDGIDIKNEQVLEQVFKQTSELYINGNGDIYNRVKNNESLLNGDANLSPKMITIYKEIFPNYPIDLDNDFKYCLNLAYKIAEKKGWTKESVLNGNMDSILSVWRKVVHFTAKDNWFSGRTIKDLSSPNEWARLVKAMTSKPKKEEIKTQSTAAPLRRI